MLRFQFASLFWTQSVIGWQPILYRNRRTHWLAELWLMTECVPNGSLFPPECYWLWSKVTHYVGNRVPIGCHLGRRHGDIVISWWWQRENVTCHWSNKSHLTSSSTILLDDFLLAEINTISIPLDGPWDTSNCGKSQSICLYPSAPWHTCHVGYITAEASGGVG